MTDADLIYNALLRTEKRLEAELAKPGDPRAYEPTLGAFIAVSALREEIGNGLSEQGR